MQSLTLVLTGVRTLTLFLGNAEVQPKQGECCCQVDVEEWSQRAEQRVSLLL